MYRHVQPVQVSIVVDVCLTWCLLQGFRTNFDRFFDQSLRFFLQQIIIGFGIIFSFLGFLFRYFVGFRSRSLFLFFQCPYRICHVNLKMSVEHWIIHMNIEQNMKKMWTVIVKMNTQSVHDEHIIFHVNDEHVISSCCLSVIFEGLSVYRSIFFNIFFKTALPYIFSMLQNSVAPSRSLPLHPISIWDNVFRSSHVNSCLNFSKRFHSIRSLIASSEIDNIDNNSL